MSDVTVVPGPIDDWQALVPTDPEGIPVPVRAIVAYGPDGRAWTDEDVRRYWRRTARTTMRAAFLRDGYTAEVAKDVAVRMERAMRGYHGQPASDAWRASAEPGAPIREAPDGPPSPPVPFFALAWEGAMEGFWQAWNQPQELLDLGEDEAPTLADQQAAVDRARHARALYTTPLNRPKGSAA